MELQLKLNREPIRICKQCGDITMPQIKHKIGPNRTRRKSTVSGGELTMQLSKKKLSTHGLAIFRSQMRLDPNALLEDGERTTDSRDKMARSSISTISLLISSMEIVTELRR